jgi:uncharacterized membrane protein YbaN (DUF454 family)
MLEDEMQKKNQICTTSQCLRPRPLWQRLVYPLVGVVLVVVGVILWIMPVVPGFPLIIIGVLLCACLHPRLELWVRRQMHVIGHAIRQKVKHKK